MEKTSLKLFVAFYKANKAVSKHMEATIRTYGLNTTEFAVLELLYHKGAFPVQQIGEKILLSSGSLTYVVDKLVKKGLLERIPCEKDRRVIYVSMTPQGQALIAAIFPDIQAAIHDLMSCLSLKQQQEMIASLKTLGVTAESRLKNEGIN